MVAVNRRSVNVVVLVVLAVVASLLGSNAAAGSPTGGASNSAVGVQSHVASAFGRAVVDGQEAIVHVTVAAGSHVEADRAARAEIGRRGAVPVDSAAYTENGTWKQFSDNSAGNDHVAFAWSTYGQGANYLDLTDAATVWNGVASSAFEFLYGTTTGECPSLVDECPGSQEFNGVNEAGWVDLGGRAADGSLTLGVTWFNFRTRGGPFAAPQEADVALNSSATWGQGGFDVETVAAHEMGHAAGLGHSSDSAALMYAWYQGARSPLLGSDDVAGISALYPTGDDTSDSSGSVPGYCKKHPERDGCP